VYRLVVCALDKVKRDIGMEDSALVPTSGSRPASSPFVKIPGRPTAHQPDPRRPHLLVVIHVKGFVIG
jgi:hypothetical protein